ncbi:MAG: carbohydrate porin [Tepidisphaeraceae bacterium]
MAATFAATLDVRAWAVAAVVAALTGAAGADQPGLADGPAEPHRAGQSTPGVGNGPSVVPGQTPIPSDANLLNQTAGELGVAAPGDRIDEQLLGWFGARSFLADRGLTVDLTVTADYSKNLRGGLDTRGDAFRHLFDARINFDTQPLLNWPGGMFSLDFQNQNGRNGSDLLTGDAQGFDNADADGRTQLSELWYEQRLLNNLLRFKIGKVDANTEFAAPENATEFINSSFGYSPTITGLPTYPDPAMSFNVFVYPTPWLYAGYGIYDGGDGVTTGDHPPTTAWRSPTDYFQIAELGVRWVLADNTLPGRVAGGVFYTNGDFEKFDGTHQSGTSGFYFVADQKIYHYNYYAKDDPRGVYAFAQYGWGDQQVNDFREHVSAGLTWMGPYPAKSLDSLGVAVSTVFFSDAAGAPFTRDSETNVEAYYNFQATTYLSIKPDLQYIVHPGGDAALKDALVATLRVTVAF